MKYKQVFSSSLLLIVFSFVMTAENVYGQNFKEGYIITNSNDSIHGMINFSGKKIFKICQFKAASQSKAVVYHPGEIKGFRFLEGKYFISRTLDIDEKEELLFLEFIIQGKASIYYYRDTNDHYYVETENSAMVELSQHEVYIDIEGGNSSVSYRMPSRHNTKLKAILADCPQIYPQIETVSLNHKSLTKLARNYHYEVCDTEDCIVFEREETKTTLNFSAWLGGGGHIIYLGPYLTSDVGYCGQFGGRLQVSNIFAWTEKLGFSVGIVFQNYSNYTFSILNEERVHITDEGIEYDYWNSKWYEDQVEEFDAKMNLVFLRVPFTIDYTIIQKQLSPYLGIGMINQFLLSQNKDFLYKHFADEFGYTVPFYHVGFVGRLGTKYYLQDNKALLFEVIYEYTSNMNTNKLFKMKIDQIGINLGYQF